LNRKRKFFLRVSAILCVSIFCSAALSFSAVERREIVMGNASFEQEVKPGVPKEWWFFPERGTVPASGRLVMGEDFSHTGERCPLIEGKSDDSIASWIYSGKLKSGNDEYRVEGEKNYEFSGWVKMEGVKGSVFLGVGEFDD